MRFDSAAERRPADRSAAALPLLEVSDITVRFGGIVALDGIPFSVARGQTVGLVGPNGAGKTTIFNCISRLYAAKTGDIFFDGVALSTVPRHRIAALGIGRTFQNLALFKTLTVRENLLTGAHVLASSGFLAHALALPRAGREEREIDRRADELLEFLDLTEVADRAVGDLPFGTLKRVELGRALASGPKLLLLDEPACGLNHEEVEALGTLIREIRTRFDMTILLVEHHMALVMSISDKVVALNFGQKIADGSPDEVRSNAEVIRAYLGQPK